MTPHVDDTGFKLSALGMVSLFQVENSGSELSAFGVVSLLAWPLRKAFLLLRPRQAGGALAVPVAHTCALALLAHMCGSYMRS